MARLHGGHRGVIKEGLVILVSQRPAWGRALISTNRFLIRASRALQHPLPVRVNTHWRAHICAGRSPVSKPSKRGIILPGCVMTVKTFSHSGKWNLRPANFNRVQTTAIPSRLKGRSRRKQMGGNSSGADARCSRHMRCCR